MMIRYIQENETILLKIIKIKFKILASDSNKFIIYKILYFWKNRWLKSHFYHLSNFFLKYIKFSNQGPKWNLHT